LPEDEARHAWSHFMAVGAGTHPWPDANHRTALLAFDLALVRSAGREVILAPAVAQKMIRKSKDMRDHDRLSRPGRARYYTIKELADPEHPYRRLFASFEDALEIVSPD
jgi:hypothetical protein